MHTEENPCFEEENEDGNKSPIDDSQQYSAETAVEELNKLKNDLQKLNVSVCKNEQNQYEAEYLLQQLIKHLSKYDTKFLINYLDVLKLKNMSTISKVTGDIISAIEMIISKEKEEGPTLQEPAKVVLVSWLCASILWNAPRVPSALPVLRALLPLLNINEVESVAAAWAESAPPAALLELSDAAGGAGGALGAALLRGGAARGGAGGDALLPERVRGRELRAGGPPTAPDQLARPTLSKANNVAEIQKVLVISKLHTLFKESEGDSQGSTKVTNV